MPQKVMPPSLTAPIALFVVAPCFVFGVVLRCAMKLLPCKILGDARKSRQHAVFERCPERCPNDARPDGSRPAKSTSPKPLTLHASTPRGAPAKHLTLPAHIVMLGLDISHISSTSQSFTMSLCLSLSYSFISLLSLSLCLSLSPSLSLSLSLSLSFSIFVHVEKGR